jgi:hypothetical protein
MAVLFSTRMNCRGGQNARRAANRVPAFLNNECPRNDNNILSGRINTTEPFYSAAAMTHPQTLADDSDMCNIFC